MVEVNINVVVISKAKPCKLRVNVGIVVGTEWQEISYACKCRLQIFDPGPIDVLIIGDFKL